MLGTLLVRCEKKKQSSKTLEMWVSPKEKSQFDLKSRVTGGTKIRPVIPSNNWRIIEIYLTQISN